jgi:cyclase
MLTKRIIACLDVKDGEVVKGVRFAGLSRAGACAPLARRYSDDGIDELVVLDVSATLEGRRVLLDTIRSVADEVFIPLTVGGGIRSAMDAMLILAAGADKVALNSAAIDDPTLISDIARRAGSQAVVTAIDVRRQAGRWTVFSRSATAHTGLDPVEWAKEAQHRGAGEILLTSIDRDGTRQGFDLELTAAVSRAVTIPVIASGGAGSIDDFVDVFTAGHADAALAASILHFGEHAIRDIKTRLRDAAIPVRLPC